MRIISQGGHADLLYEESVICTATEDIIARCGDKEYLMGRYSSMDKVKKVLKMLHEAYTGMPIIFQNVELDDSVKKMFSDFRKNGIILHSFEDTEPKVEYVNNLVFQFPKDEEIEA